jgi:peptidoglycan/xylan/chitin deacetylase (PgdA/CDA1 family)
LDDGPHPTYTPKILDALLARGVRVNFFHTGEMTARAPELSARCAKEGHVMGSHTWSHELLTSLSMEKAQSQIIRGRDQVAQSSGKTTRFFRYPFGGRSKKLDEFLKQEKMASFMWNIDSLDWKLRSSTKTYDNVMTQLEIQKGGIVLFHDIQPHTAVVLPLFIDEIHRRGYKTVVFVNK